MKIELEIPYIDNEELSIKITIKKDGEVLVSKNSGTTSPPTKPKKKTPPPSTPGSFGGNFMNAEF